MTKYLVFSGLALLIIGAMLFRTIMRKPIRPCVIDPEELEISSEVLFRVGPALLKGEIMYLNRVEEYAFIRQCSPNKEMHSVEFHQIIEIL